MDSPSPISQCSPILSLLLFHPCPIESSLPTFATIAQTTQHTVPVSQPLILMTSLLSLLLFHLCAIESSPPTFATIAQTTRHRIPVSQPPILMTSYPLLIYESTSHGTYVAPLLANWHQKVLRYHLTPHDNSWHIQFNYKVHVDILSISVDKQINRFCECQSKQYNSILVLKNK